MRNIGIWFQSDARRWASALLIGSLVTGSISLISFAKPSDTEPIFEVSVSDKTPKGHSVPRKVSSLEAYSTTKIASGSDAYITAGIATSSDAYATAGIASDSEAYYEQFSESDWDHAGGRLSHYLQQSETEGDFTVCHLVIKLENEKITDGEYLSPRTNHLDNFLKENQRIEPDWKLKYSVHVNVNPRKITGKGGSGTSWNLGRVEGLNFPEDGIDITVKYGNREIGTAVASYTDEGELWIETVLNESIGLGSSNIYFYYILEVGFEPVYEETELEILLPGNEEPIVTLLQASEKEIDPGETTTEGTSPEETTTEGTSPEETTTEGTSPEETTTEGTSPEETTPEETSPEETTPEETSPEETTPEETSPEETTPEETSPEETTPEETTKGNSGGGSADRWKPNPTAAAETIPTTAESAEETIPETTVSETQKPAESKETDNKDKKSDKDKNDAEKQQEPNVDLIIAPQTIVPSGASSEAVPGETVTFQMSLRNDGEESINNIRVRDYLPEHTVFIGTDLDGIYGVFNGRQRVTWIIDSLNPGEEKSLAVEVKVFECTPEGYSVKNKVFWEKDSEDSVNAMKDPSEIMEFNNITIR